MTDKTINLEIDGRAFEAREGESVLEAATREGIAIPTLCHHDGIEPSGACRLCVVEITHADWKGWKGLVTACLYPVEEGLRVTTDNPEIHKARKTILDLLLARCPGSDVIRKLAARYGVTRTSFKESDLKTTCILCGLCVRVCAVKGVDAINSSGRGIGKRIAIPFKQPPPDCIGCLSCAHICPTNTIKFEERKDDRRIWGRTFEMIACESCGKPIMPEAQAAFEAKRSGLDAGYFRTCPACSIASTVKTIGSSFDLESSETNE
jgi:NADH dehydrogenase/NADH:ubiquinone oxidoreductase subunit G